MNPTQLEAAILEAEKSLDDLLSNQEVRSVQASINQLGPRLCYICHPFTTHGDADANYEAQLGICNGYNNLDFAVPVSPIITFGKIIPKSMDHYRIAMISCIRLLAMCNELHAYGEWYRSKGCMIELVFCQRLGKRVRFSSGGKGPAETDFLTYDPIKMILTAGIPFHRETVVTNTHEAPATAHH